MVKGNPNDFRLALLPLLAPLIVLLQLMDNPLETVQRWIRHWFNNDGQVESKVPSIGSQLLAYVIMATLGYFLTSRMVPTIKVYMLKRGICGKDLGKRGTSIADKDM